MVSITVGGSIAGKQGRALDVDIATPSERSTDDACAAQDSATETLSQGLARHRSGPVLDRDGPLDRLAQTPSPLDRLTKGS